MKTLLPFVLLFITLHANAQLLFHENFENPDSVISVGNSPWALCNQAQTSGLFCDSVSTTDSTFLTTIPFSTVGAYRVILTFNHVLTSELSTELIDISIDGGITWTDLGNNEYLGSASTSSFFGTWSYMNWWPGTSFSGPIDNSKWHLETFDLSAICSNQPNVLMRFKFFGDPNIIGGWFIDDVSVAGFPYSITSTISCGNDGTATMIPYFGTGPYTYIWNSSPAQTTQTANNLPPGFYTCTVSDGVTSYTDSIEVKPVFTVSSNVQHPTCGMNNGAIYLMVSGGNPPYSFNWSNGGTGSQMTGLPEGTYWITVTDNNGCYVTKTFVLDCGFNSASLVITNTAAQCDSATGTATVVSFTGAVPPLTYSWNTIPVQTTQTATGLEGRKFHMVTVKDANGDSAVAGIFIPFNDTIIASATYTPTVCNSNTGTATGVGNGGVAPYTYQWSTAPVQTTQTAIGLSNSPYTVTITDANGCTDNASITIPNQIGMTAFTTTTPATCGFSDGTATVTVINGTNPITYLWSSIPPQTTASATNLPRGGYQVTITDSNGCVLVKSAYVQEVSNMVLNVSYSSLQCSCAVGNIAVSGGTPPYSYLWGNGDTTQNNLCLAYGWNNARVTDANGCTQFKHFFVNFPANCFVDVRGFVFADLNKNCIKDANEYGIANVGLSLTGTNNNYYTYTNNTGWYSFHALADIYALTQNVPSLWGQFCPVQSPDTINVPAGTIVSKNIADTAASYFDDAAINNCYATPNVRGFDNYHHAHIKNNGTTLLNGLVTLKLDPNVTFLSASPNTASYNLATNTVTWSYINLIPREVRNFTATTIIPATTPLGTIMFDTSQALPLITDSFPINNTCYSRETVVGSYDPNNKIAFPEGDVQKDSLWHTYVINFQNTGSSYAVRVIVEDTLNTNLDFVSFTDVLSSHSFVLDTSNLPLVRFIYNNIYLPDSSFDEPGSHGFVSFRIKHKPGLNAGAIITNTAYIYFDFNSAVITNTVQTLLVNPTSTTNLTINNIEVSIYPNPVSNELNIVLPSDNKMQLEIFDIAGKSLIKKQIEKTSVVKLKQLSGGVYFYRLTSSNGEFVTGKLIKK